MILKIKMIEIDGFYDFKTECENVSDYSIERTLLFFEKQLKFWMDTGLYDISTFKFEVSDEKIEKVKRIPRMAHGLSIRYTISNDGEEDLFYSWDGKREMDWHSKLLSRDFESENGLLEVLECMKFNKKTIKMEIKTIKRFY